MPFRRPTCRTLLAATAACVLSVCGCATQMVPSQRLHQPVTADFSKSPVQIGGHRFMTKQSGDCVSCEDRQRLSDYVHRAAPYVGGPFMHPHRGAELAAQQDTIQPPHSKFHPVPTRPVFETRATYSQAQPIGVHLVPVPDHGFHNVGPVLQQPSEMLSSPPTPPSIDSNSLRSNGDLDDDTFMLPPPSE